MSIFHQHQTQNVAFWGEIFFSKAFVFSPLDFFSEVWWQVHIPVGLPRVPDIVHILQVVAGFRRSGRDDQSVWDRSRVLTCRHACHLPCRAKKISARVWNWLMFSLDIFNNHNHSTKCCDSIENSPLWILVSKNWSVKSEFKLNDLLTTLFQIAVLQQFWNLRFCQKKITL